MNRIESAGRITREGLITDADGERVSYHKYQPFGWEMTPPYQDDEAKKFTGHERDYYADPGTSFDLDYMHARYYSPWERRFLSVDPVGEDPRVPQSWNAFSYVLNNPINLVDPYGLMECTYTNGTLDCTEDFLPIDYLSAWDDWKNRGYSAWAGQELDPNAVVGL